VTFIAPPYRPGTWVTPQIKDMGYSMNLNQPDLPMGPLFAAEQRRLDREFGRALGELGKR